MKVPKSMLEQIVKEEIAAHVRELLEAPAGIVDADDEKKDKEKKGGKGEESPTKPSGGPTKPKQQSDKPMKAAPKDEPRKGPKPGPSQPEPEDGMTSGDQDTEDGAKQDDKHAAEDPEAKAGEEEDAEDVTGGKIADAINGKTVQSITMEPESKILPGAQEVNITFREMPDPLKILITKTGQAKFYFRGLHNTLGEANEPAMDAPVPQGANPGNVTKKTKHSDKFSMSNDEYLGWTKNPPNNLTIVSAVSGKPIAQMDKSAIQWALKKAAFMRGMSKNVGSDVDYWTAPIVRGRG